MDNVHHARWIFWLVILTTAHTLRAGPADDQYQLAAHHYRYQRWALAAGEFETFLQRFPEDGRVDDASFYLAESLVQQHDFTRAQTQLAKYLAANSAGRHTSQALFRKGELSYLQEDFDLAGPDLEDFHTRFPNDPLNVHALYYLGEIALAGDSPDTARDWFQRCLKLRPEGVLGDDCRFGLARALETGGDIDGAKRFYAYLADKPAAAHRDEAQLQLAIILYHQDHFADARAGLQQLKDRVTQGDCAAQAWYWLGMSQLATEKWEQATATLSQAAAKFKTNALAPAMQFSAAEALRKSGKLESAQVLYADLVTGWPASQWADDAQQILVQIAWDTEHLEDVERLADQFQQQFPTSPLRWLVRQTRGRAMLKQGRYPDALTVFQQLAQEPGAGVEDHQPDNESNPLRGPVADARQPLAAKVAVPMETDTPTPAACVPPSNWYYLALAQLGTNQLDDAVKSLDQLRAVKQPELLVRAALVARAAALVGLQRFDEAIVPLEQYLAAAPNGTDSAKCRAQLAVAYAKTGQWAQARHAVEQLDPNAASQSIYYETIQYVAEAAYERKQLDVAADMFRRLTREGAPPEYVARGFSGLAWLQWDQNPGSVQAAVAFDKLIERFPHNELAAEAAMMRGRAMEQQGKPEAALAMYRLIIEQFTDSEQAPPAALAAAKIHAQLQQGHEAETILRDLMKQHPKYRTDAVVYQLAWVLVDSGKLDQADQLFTRLHDEMPTSPYWSDATYRLAESAVRAKQVRRADQLAGELIDSTAGRQMVPYALYLRGQIAATEQRWEDVLQWMQQLVRSFPQSPLVPPARYWLAEAHYRLQQYTEAAPLFDALADDPATHDQPWLAMVALRRAQVQAQKHEWDNAFAIASGIVTQFPKFDRQYEADYVLGRYYSSRAEFQQARAAYQRVIDSSTGAKTETAAMSQWMIGETYFLQKQYDQAIKAYYRVEGLYDYPRWQAAALLQAGKCHEMVGRWSDAISVYTQIMSDYAKTEFADTAATRLRVARQRADLSQTR